MTERSHSHYDLMMLPINFIYFVLRILYTLSLKVIIFYFLLVYFIFESRVSHLIFSWADLLAHACTKFLVAYFARLALLLPGSFDEFSFVLLIRNNYYIINHHNIVHSLHPSLLQSKATKTYRVWYLIRSTGLTPSLSSR
jgi:hypothetical protein